jgi:O-acetylhomoserine (thiol)-lyase
MSWIFFILWVEGDKMHDFSTRASNPTGAMEAGYKALRPPLYDSVAFEFESSKDIQLAFEGRKSAFAYSRVSNPTVSEFENRIKDLSGSIGVLALSSGMAAISNTVLALAGAGTNGVIAKTLFGNSVSLFKETLGPWGFESRFVDITDMEAVESRIDKNPIHFPGDNQQSSDGSCQYQKACRYWQ